MQCLRCHFDNRPGRKFCATCGQPLSVPCAHCGYANEPGDRFCGDCGKALSAGPIAPPRLIAPQSHTPNPLAQDLIASKGALEGERKQVTILFADLKGSLEMLADRDPEDARKLLDAVLERMMEAVHRFEGTVNTVMGDGIMALFGAPLAHEDHAVRACYAALVMQESLKRYAEEARRAYGVTVQIRVGLNTGEVIVRSMRGDFHLDYAAVGQATHLASRMEQAALPGSVVMTRNTLRLAEGYVQTRALGPVPIKGLSDPVDLYELIGIGPSRTRFQTAAARGLTRLVGREAELDQLRQALEQVRLGRGQVVGIVGEPGVGKSRLVWELAHSPGAQGWLTLRSGAASYGKATPYLPVIDLIKAYCQIEDRNDPRKIEERLTGKLLTLDRTLETALPALLALLDVPHDDREWQAIDPLARRQRTLDAVKRLLLRESQAQPLLLVFEDLQWIDSETQALLDALVESLPAARVFLLVNYRPAYQHAWGHKTYYSQVRLDPLPPASVGVFLGSLLGEDASLRSLKAMLTERTEGNPFFLEESVRALVEADALAGEPGGYRLTKPLEVAAVPANVQAVLAARIDRLPPEEKALLQCASVIGKDVPHAILHAIAEEPEPDLRRRLDHLQAAEFLYEARLFPDLEYTFKHALTYEVAYGSLLHERRRILHARIVDAIERLNGDRLAEHVERLAHHAFCAEAWEKALAYLRQAGAKAFGKASHREAARHFEHALVALGHLPETRDHIEQGIDIRFDLQLSLLPLGELERGLAYLREAESLVAPLDDPRRSGQLLIYMMGQFYLMGDLGRALELGQRALSIAEGLSDFGLRVSANAYLGQVYHARGDYRRAAASFRLNVEALVGELARERFGLPQLPAVHSRTCLVWSLAELGEFAEGIARGEEGIQIAQAAEQPFSLAVAYSGLGGLYVRQGDFPAAISLLERGLELTRAEGIALWFPRIASDLSLAYAMSGRLEEALPLMQSAVEQAAAMHLLVSYSLLVVSRAEIGLLMGRLDEAAEQAGRALELSRERAERGNEVRALRLLGELALRADPLNLERAAEHYRQARALAEELGMRPLVARSLLGLGRASGSAKDLALAADLFRELAMPFWARQAEEALPRISG